MVETALCMDSIVSWLLRQVRQLVRREDPSFPRENKCDILLRHQKILALGRSRSLRASFLVVHPSNGLFSPAAGASFVSVSVEKAFIIGPSSLPAAGTATFDEYPPSTEPG
jgi:hypothetical protein